LCDGCKGRTFLCELCFKNKNEVGDADAKRRARARERMRRWRARLRNKRTPERFPPDQETLWPREVLLSLPVLEPPPAECSSELTGRESTTDDTLPF
jgi:hypothetical protein